MTPEVDLQAAGLVIGFLTPRKSTGKVPRLSEVSPIVGEQGTEGHKRLLTTWKFTFVGPLRFKVHSLVTGEPSGTAKPLAADVTGEGVVLLVVFDVGFEVVNCSKASVTALDRALKRSLFVVGLKVSFEFIGGSEGPATALHCALERSWIFSMV